MVLFVSSSNSLRVVEKSASVEDDEVGDCLDDMPNKRRIASPTQSEHFCVDPLVAFKDFRAMDGRVFIFEVAK